MSSQSTYLRKKHQRKLKIKTEFPASTIASSALKTDQFLIPQNGMKAVPFHYMSFSAIVKSFSSRSHFYQSYFDHMFS